jgi:hypothetical protein
MRDGFEFLEALSEVEDEEVDTWEANTCISWCRGCYRADKRHVYLEDDLLGKIGIADQA